ncbi:hypothetical protein HHK36_031815 [Tetracentron sinense]|uniref:Uncharacterized protein n=1 Tax=Tetracentron sinense TaxID=13715 RepID=A0A834YBX7_TETSI|nr:hypothetical protein HHK36_031815 [Tetracentron sinense]
MIFDRGSIQSNLDRFIDCTTPVIQSQFLPKISIRNLNRLWHPWERETVEYFTLGDLWSCYDEWSAYGAGVPIVLNNKETVVQYYVPYLSAIQIFTSNASLSSFHEESETGDCETRDSFSDSCSDDCESEKLWRWDGCSSEDGVFEQDCLWHLSDRLGYLYFQFFERSAPYGRVPLMDKINGLARRYPGLMTSKSVDLSPASWMAVAWSLSLSLSMYMDPEENTGITERKRKEGEGITLSPFGLATYKMKGSVWVAGESGHDQERLMLLFSTADSWLKQLRVQHHDFNYFIGIRHG